MMKRPRVETSDADNNSRIMMLNSPPLELRILNYGEDDDSCARLSEGARVSLGDQETGAQNPTAERRSKRKRTRTMKSSEEVENQRINHIEIERNRRKQVNEHLYILRALMPSSYAQRIQGDQASIVGGAIQFIKELQHLLQCLESQKRRKLLGDTSIPRAQQQPPKLHPLHRQMMLNLREEIVENKSSLADVEVKVLGFDALIKILSRNRPRQLFKIMASLEDIRLTILHTNVTTVDQSVLYSFNVKIIGETRFTAEEIANSVQRIFSFLHICCD